LSTYLHTEARVGDVLCLGRPAGDFVVPEDFAGKLLLVSGGSGITPVLSIARDLAARDRLRDVVFVHAARSEAALPQAIRRELEALPFAGVHFLVGPLTPERLAEIVPDRHTYSKVYLCGPAPMMERFVDDAGGIPTGVLVTERFQAPRESAPSCRGEGEVTPVKVELGRGRVVVVGTTPSLLEALEAAGERPRYGCRQGICNSCRCEKRSGIVEDLRTGKRSGPHAEEIRLCTSRAVSELELDLGDLR
jgi:ferredoxin-NADP reductase